MLLTYFFFVHAQSIRIVTKNFVWIMKVKIISLVCKKGVTPPHF